MFAFFHCWSIWVITSKISTSGNSSSSNFSKSLKLPKMKTQLLMKTGSQKLQLVCIAPISILSNQKSIKKKKTSGTLVSMTVLNCRFNHLKSHSTERIEKLNFQSNFWSTMNNHSISMTILSSPKRSMQNFSQLLSTPWESQTRGNSSSLTQTKLVSTSNLCL